MDDNFSGRMERRKLGRMDGAIMAKAPPCFDFYYNDWIGGVQDLSPECERHYLRLLIYQWQNGEIPKSKTAQMNVCGITNPGNWDAIWAQIAHKFAPFEYENGENGVYFAQERMKNDRDKAIPKWLHNKELSEVRRAAGKLGGRPKSKTKAKRKQKLKQNESKKKQTWKEEEGCFVFDSPLDPDSSLNPKTPNSAQAVDNAQSSQSADPDKGTKKTAADSFAEFWSAYPVVCGPDGRTVPKGNRAIAEKRWAAMSASSRAEAVAILPALREYLIAHSQCNQHAATWLHQRGWLTDYVDQVQAKRFVPSAKPEPPTIAEIFATIKAKNGGGM